MPQTRASSLVRYRVCDVMPQTRASSLVRYRVFNGGSQVHEVTSLEEFLASALSNRWLILLSLQKPPPGPKAWCPSLQPTLLENGEIAKELKDRHCLKKLVVADASQPQWQQQIKEITAAESAFVSMLNLLKQEDASSRIKTKSRKASTIGRKGKQDVPGDVQRAEQGMQQAGKEKGVVEELLMAEETTAEKEKGGDGSRPEVPTGFEPAGNLMWTSKEAMIPEEIARDVKTAEDIVMTEQGTEKTTGQQEGGSNEKPQHDAGQPLCKEDVLFDELFFEGGKIMHNEKQLSSLEMMVKFLNGMHNLQKGMQSLGKGLQGLQQGQQDLLKNVQDIQKGQQDLQKGQQDLQKGHQAIHKSLSSTGERVSKLSLALLYGQYTSSRTEYPVTTRWIPYNPTAMDTHDLEHLAVFCKPHPKDAAKSKPSGLVEVDILIKIYKEDARYKVYTSPMSVKTSRLLADHLSTFTHVVLGESSRSIDLCASAEEYKHPESPCRTPSTKLLKKLVQIERGIVATLYYYNAPRDGTLVDAAAIISPSFRQLTDPDSLLLEVLSHTHALPNVSRLARENRM